MAVDIASFSPERSAASFRTWLGLGLALLAWSWKS
jgi:hypothetical protein